jgi:hypothetical protein
VRLAFQASGLDAAALSSLNAGIMGGTAWGCQSTAELFFADFILKGPRLVKPFLFPHAYANTAVSLAAMEWTLKGPHENVVTRATASGWRWSKLSTTSRRTEPAIAVGGAERFRHRLQRADRTGVLTPMGEAPPLWFSRGPMRKRGSIRSASVGLRLAPTPKRRFRPHWP